LAPIQLAVGATMISFSAVFVKWVHVGPTTAGFCRMLFGAIILSALVLIRKEKLFFGTLHFLKEIAGKGFSDLESKKPCSGLRFVVCLIFQRDHEVLKDKHPLTPSLSPTASEGEEDPKTEC
jgi:hypothetical protein